MISGASWRELDTTKWTTGDVRFAQDYFLIRTAFNVFFIFTSIVPDQMRLLLLQKLRDVDKCDIEFYNGS